MALKEPKPGQESNTDWERLKRQDEGREPIDFSDILEKNSEWFKQAQISYPGWIVLKTNVDRDVFEYIKSRWPDHLINTLNQVLQAYMVGKLNVVIPVQEYSSDRVKVVGKYDPAVVDWVNKMPNSDGFVSLILRDFMQSCKEREARGETVGDS